MWSYLTTTFIFQKMASFSMIIEQCTRSILPPCPSIGCGVVDRHLEMAQPTIKPKLTWTANIGSIKTYLAVGEMLRLAWLARSLALLYWSCSSWVCPFTCFRSELGSVYRFVQPITSHLYGFCKIQPPFSMDHPLPILSFIFSLCKTNITMFTKIKVKMSTRYRYGAGIRTHDLLGLSLLQ